MPDQIPPPTSSESLRDAPDQSEGRGVSPSEVANTLSALSGFLRLKTEGGETAIAIVDETANLARIHIVPEPIASPQKKELPVWARNLPHPDTIFVPMSREIRLWRAVSEPFSRGSSDIIVKYQRFDDQLTPGGTAHEQGIALPMLDHKFTIDEWGAIVQPILDRYVKALELKVCARAVREDQKTFGERIRTLLPQVFSKKDADLLQAMDVLSGNFQKCIREMVNAINTNPDILKHWILEQLTKKEEDTISGVSFEKGVGKEDGSSKPISEAKKPYEDLRQKAMITRITARFRHKKTEQNLNSYVDDLAAKISHLGQQLLFLNTKYREGLYRAPVLKSDYEETPYFRRLLAEFTQSAMRQLNTGKGMISLIGDMGTGKNYLVEHFAAKTHRPFFYFPCARGMDAADLGFHFEYRKGETMVLPSNLAKGLQTPNAVILIDEPNALPPEVVASLHGLADHNRSFIYNGVEFKAVEGVIIVMAMNPATYSHVKSLPEAIADRTLGQDIVMDYPPLTKLDLLAQEHLWTQEQIDQEGQKDNNLKIELVCDEALILRRYFPSLKPWAEEDFMHLWDIVVNGKGEALLGDKTEEIPAVRKDVEVISKILKICDAWRKKYKAGNMQRTISLRGAIAVTEKYQETKNIRTAFLLLYCPNSFKYDGGKEDYETLEQVLNDQGELKMTMNEVLGVQS